MQLEEVFDSLALGGKSGTSVKPVHSAVEVPMRRTQDWRHGVWVVEHVELRIRKRGARIENGLRQYV